MKKQVLYVSLSTLLLALLVALALLLGVARAGLVPIQADAAPSALEKRFFAMTVRASVARNAAGESKADSLAGEDLQSGAEIYKGMCAQCHGQLNGKPSVIGASFYRSEEHTSELQSLRHLVCRLLLEKKKKNQPRDNTY